jgi:hypothetical protein
MKLRAIFLGLLSVLLLTGTASSAPGDELVLDWPHNEDNGIYCYHCHSEDPTTGDDWWITTENVPTYPDFTVANWVCNRCHLPEGERTIDDYVGLWDVELNGGSGDYRLNGPALAGPEKTLHSKTTTGSTKPAWTTQCIDCHDPHFQTQKDWGVGTEDGVGIYIATGEYSVAGPLDTPVADPKAGPLGASTRGITLDADAGDAIYPVCPPVPDDGRPCDWTRKGKPADFEKRDIKLGDGNGTRGLILVVDSGSPVSSRTYEIIGVSGTFPDYILTVNGELVALDVQDGAKFGILYGASIRKNVITPDGTRKPVKYFSPFVVADDYGGTVDLTPGVTEPVGLCQVCHTDANISYYDSTTDENGHHDSDLTECTECHDILEGGEPVLDHTAYTTATTGCEDCHVDYNTTPDTAHIGSVANGETCQTCHTSQAPWMNSYVDGARIGFDSDGILQVGAPLPCIQCHNNAYGPYNVDYETSHPAALQNTNKDNGHLAALTTQILCSNCHLMADAIDIILTTTGPDTPAGHGDDCLLCHLTVTPSPVELTPIAERAREIDGTIPAPVKCDRCHITGFTGHLHDHTTSVVVNSVGTPNTVNCIGCHDNAPAGNGPFIGSGEVHARLGCAFCHETNGALTAIPAAADPDLILPNGVYECVECHTAHFDGHSRGTKEYADPPLLAPPHDVRFVAGTDVTGGGTDCFKCHDDAGLGKGTSALTTWDAIMIEHQTIDGAGPLNACDVCHNYTQNDNRSGDGTPGPGGVDTPEIGTVDTVISGGGSVTCIDCHVAKNGPHGSHLSGEFAWDDNTKASCGGGGVANACHDWQNNQDVVLNVHGHIPTYLENGRPCDLCHQDAQNNLYARLDGTGKDGNAQNASNRTAVCTVCHVVSTDAEIGAIHHFNDSPYTGEEYEYTPIDDCTVKCHTSESNTGHPADHNGGTPGMVRNNPVEPGVQKDCSDCHVAYSLANINNPVHGNNTKVDPLDDLVHDACKTCHTINGTSNIVELIGLPSPRTLVTDMPIGGGEGGTDGGGTCTACHTTYFEAHTHHDNGATNNFIYNGGLAQVEADEPHFDPVKLSPYYVDVSWDVTVPGPAGCGVAACHDDYYVDGYTGFDQSLDTWPGIRYEHDRVGTPDGNVKDVDGTNSCYNCHYTDGRGGDSINAGLTIDDKFPDGSTVADVVTKGTKRAGNITEFVSCTDCHFLKKSPAVHGLILINHFEVNQVPDQGNIGYAPIQANPECSKECHFYSEIDSGGGLIEATDADDIIIGIHGNACGICHASQPNLLTAAGSNFDSVKTGTSPMWCTDCHQDLADVNDNMAKPFHGVVPDDALLGASHNRMNDAGYSDLQGGSGYDCMKCHAEMTLVMVDVLLRHMPNFDTVTPANTPRECLVCHDPAAFSGDNLLDPVIPDTKAKAIILDGKLGSLKVAGNDAVVVCESCHTEKYLGLVTPGYRLHGLTGNTGLDGVADEHDNLAVEVSPGDCSNLGCHVMGSATERLALHTKDCFTCHSPDDASPAVPNPDSDGSVNVLTQVDDGLPPSNDWYLAGGDNPVECDQCHLVTDSFNKHGLLANDADTVHENLAGSSATGGTDPLNCENCHNSSDAETRIGLHQNCNTCHDPAKTDAMAQIGIGMFPSVTGINCEDCHDVATEAYSMHKMTVTEVGAALIHENIGDSSCSAAGCHDLSSETKMLELHTSPLQGHNGTCLTCHNPAKEVPAPLPDDPAISPSGGVVFDGQTGGVVVGGNGNPVTCVSCHNGAYLTHGLTDGTVEGGHDYLLGSSATPGSPADCGECHTGANTVDDATGRLFLHDNCATCHNAAGGEAANQIGLGIGTTDVNCEHCHFSVGDYTMHGLTEATVLTAHGNLDSAGVTGDDDCANCHLMGTTAAMLNLHSNPLKTEGTAGICLDCHTTNGTGAADAVILFGQTLGKVGGSDSLVYCINCHTQKDAGNDYKMHGLTDDAGTDGVVAEHEFMTVQNVGANSACDTCHTPSPTTALGRIQLHTRATVTPTTCLTCHKDGNGTVLGVITAGFNDTANSAECDDCHTAINTSWYNHNDPDHTPTILNVVLIPDAGDPKAADPTVDCDGCHTGDVIIDVHDFVLPDPTINVCEECHAADSALINSAVGKNAGGECIFCHTSATVYFDDHDTRGVDSSGHSTAMNMDADKVTPIGDYSQGVGSEKLCYQCHDDAGLGKGTSALTTWNSILTEHETVGGSGSLNSCEVCHNSARATEIDPAFTVETVQGVISQGGAVRCLSCHYDKRSPFAHGGHNDSHFLWDGDCDVCHSPSFPAAPTGANDAVVRIIHGDTCNLCHETTTSDASTNGIGTGAASYGEDGDAGLPGAEGDASDGIPWNATCLTCHPIATYDLSTVHHDSLEWSVTNPGSCTATCHPQGVSAAVSGDHATNFVKTHANCSTCHTDTAATGFDVLVNADPKTHDSCQSCHNADPNATLRTGPLADANPSGGGTCDTCHADFTIHASHNHATVVAQTDTSTPTLNCQSCHSGGTTPFVTANVHTACDSCHLAVTGDLVSGAPNGDANGDPDVVGDADGTLECGECHAAWFDGHKIHSNVAHNIQQRAGDKADGTDPCNDCHAVGGTGNSPKFSATVWGGTDGMLDLHGDSCILCHDSDRDNLSHVGSIDPAFTDESVEGVIQNLQPLTVGCLSCHYDRRNGHGGHDNTHFSWEDSNVTANSVANRASCGPTGLCHDSTIGAVGDPGVADSGLHLYGNIGNTHGDGNRCLVCHDATGGGAGNMAVFDAGEFAKASNASPNAAPHDILCTTCHVIDGSDVDLFASKGEMHHTGDDTKNGFCDTCHIDPRLVRQSGSDFRQIKQKSCRACHIEIFGGELRVLAIKRGHEGDDGDGYDTGNTYTVIKPPFLNPRTGTPFTTNHTFPTNHATVDAPAISNYGACYQCHGYTRNIGFATAVQPTPFHAMPDTGEYHLTNNTIGGNGFNDNLTPGGSESNTGIGAVFRGNQNWASIIDEPANGAGNSYFPVGKGRLNLAYTEHSLYEKASQNTAYTVVNKAAYNTYKDQPVDLTFGRQVRWNGTVEQPYYVPNFDLVCNGGANCDTVNGTAVYVKNDGNTFTATATSGGLDIHIIYGGRDIGIISNGGSLTFDTFAYGLDRYQPVNDCNVWAVSEGGGAAMIGSIDTTP